MSCVRPYTVLFLCLIALLPSLGCGSGYWVEDPHAYTWQDPQFSFKNTKRFAVVRFRDIDSTVDLPRRTEDAFAYSIINNLVGRGYTFTPSFDSADFILAPVATEAYHTRYRVTEVISAIPSLRRIPTIKPEELYFGNDADYPVATPSVGTMRSNPFLAIVLYSPRTMRPVFTYTGRAVARDTDYRIPLGMLVLHFARKLPYKTVDWKPGTGRIGIGFDLYTTDGENFWPRITRVDSNSAAFGAGLQEGDLLVEVDAVGTKNITYLKALGLLTGEVGDVKLLELWRWPGHVHNVTVTMQKREP